MMAYTPKQLKLKEYLLENIDMEGYVNALNEFVEKNNTNGYYSRESSHTQGYVLNKFITASSQSELFEKAVAYAGYKQPKSANVWLSVISVYQDLINNY